MWTKFIGRLKEQDDLIEMLRHWIVVPEYDITLSVHEAVERMENMIQEHVKNPEQSALSKLIPKLGRMTLELKLLNALERYNRETSLLNRKYIPPTFRELRMIFDYSVVDAISKKIQLVTFDADETVYRTGDNLNKSDWVIGAILKMIKNGMYVAIVTAAGYPNQPEKYEIRLGAILQAMHDEGLSAEERSRFCVVGGQCNYLCRVSDEYRYTMIPRDQWQIASMNWSEDDIAATLNTAEAVLKESLLRLNLHALIVRKERTVGFISTDAKKIPFETLEDITLALHAALQDTAVPCCAFNGGSDVFVDIGDKCFGVQALQSYLKISPCSTLHFGDGFYHTGNDLRVRSVAHTLWVANPEETCKLLSMLLEDRL